MVRRVGERRTRKARSDKKKQIRPWLPGTLLAEMKSLKKYLNQSSMASTLETILCNTLTNRAFIDYIKPFMYRSVSIPISTDRMYHATLIANPNIYCTADQLYTKIKEGITKRASFFVSQEIAEHYIHPLMSGLNVSADGLVTIALDYAVKYLLPTIAPGYHRKYHFLSNPTSSTQFGSA